MTKPSSTSTSPTEGSGPSSALTRIVALHFDRSLTLAVTEWRLGLRAEDLTHSRLMSTLRGCARAIDAHCSADERAAMDSFALGLLNGLIAYGAFDSERLADAPGAPAPSPHLLCLAGFGFRCGLLPAARLEPSARGAFMGATPPAGPAPRPLRAKSDGVLRRTDVFEIPREEEPRRVEASVASSLRRTGCVTAFAPGAIWASRMEPAPRPFDRRRPSTPSGERPSEGWDPRSAPRPSSFDRSDRLES